MPDENRPKPIPPLALLVVAFPVLGLIAWAWTAEWRWAITGLTLMFMAAALGVFLDSRKGDK